jgi:hypothetical protein
LLGFLIGAISGSVQFFLLMKFTRAVTGGKFGKKAVLFAVTQLFLPFVVLIGGAILLEAELISIAIGIAAALIGGAVIRFIITTRSSK